MFCCSILKNRRGVYSILTIISPWSSLECHQIFPFHEISLLLRASVANRAIFFSSSSIGFARRFFFSAGENIDHGIYDQRNGEIESLNVASFTVDGADAELQVGTRYVVLLFFSLNFANFALDNNVRRNGNEYVIYEYEASLATPFSQAFFWPFICTVERWQKRICSNALHTMLFSLFEVPNTFYVPSTEWTPTNRPVQHTATNEICK